MVLLIKKTIQHAQELEVVADDNFKVFKCKKLYNLKHNFY